MLKKSLAALAIAAGILLSTVVIRTALFASKQVPAIAITPLEISSEKTAKRLARAIEMQTISSRDDPKASANAFMELHSHLSHSFTLAHTKLERETVNDLSLLYTWRGGDPARAPVLLAAHMDVVPAEDQRWQYPPFAGEIADGFVWGRGAIDDKASVTGILEAIEALVREGRQPTRTIYIAFGHDEEVGGANGAAAIASLLRSRGVNLEWVLDEGGAVTQGIVPLDVPVATIGIAEKGYLTLELSVRTQGGHSMNPPRETAIGMLARAIANIEAHPFAAEITGATRELFGHIGPEMPWLRRAVFANLWLFSPLVERRLEAKPSTDATIRTTIAATIFEGGVRENVLPATARAAVNFRILPGGSVQQVLDRVRDTVDDARVEIRVLGKAFEPSQVSSARSPAYVHLAKTIRSIYPDTVVAPYLVPGATDARHYAPIAQDVYRFLPLPLNAEDLARLHGVNERISLDDYTKLIQFYAQLIATLD